MELCARPVGGAGLAISGCEKRFFVSVSIPYLPSGPPRELAVLPRLWRVRVYVLRAQSSPQLK
jgi:hypothetical protein